jgi:hypothetical protein
MRACNNGSDQARPELRAILQISQKVLELRNLKLSCTLYEIKICEPGDR